LGDWHFCPRVRKKQPHIGGPIISAEATVSIAFRSAARLSDRALCVGVGEIDSITGGSATVRIGNLPAARIGDRCAHGGAVVQGAASVLVG
jgi:uncharacterized Zn-binding protein involved in type VI secretion